MTRTQVTQTLGWLTAALFGACSSEDGGSTPAGSAMAGAASVAGTPATAGATGAGTSGGTSRGQQLPVGGGTDTAVAGRGTAGASLGGAGAGIAGNPSAAAGTTGSAGKAGPVAGSPAQIAGSAGQPPAIAGSSAPPPTGAPPACEARPITEELRSSYGLKAFYTRYADANGVPVISSDKPSAESMRRTCSIVADLSSHPKIHDVMIQRKTRFVLMAKTEKTVDVPEFAYLGDLDRRARGLGSENIAVCAEENVMCESGDRWRGESICTHEYSHTVHLGAASKADPNFNSELDAAYGAAKSKGLFANTYAGEQAAEYWAEGVQDWFNTNLASRSGMNPDGVHNHVNTRAELMAYDPTLYALIAKWMPAEPGYRDCYYYD